MTKRDVLENRVSLVKKYLSYLQEFQKYSDSEILGNIITLGALERYLYLVTDSAIELAEVVISLRGLRKPVSLAESFEVLGENRLISHELSARLVNMAKFRNVMAHLYAKIDYVKVLNIYHNHLQDITEFITVVEKL